MKKQTIFIFLIVAAGLTFFFFERKKNAKKSDLYKKDIVKLSEQHNFFSDESRNWMIMSFANGNLPLDPHIKISLENRVPELLSTLVKNGQRYIVFHYSELNCDVCVDNEIKKIKLAIERDTLLASHFLITARYANEKYLSIFKRINRVTFDIYNIIGKDIFDGKVNTPFYFILDESLSTKDMFAPDKQLPDITSDYFETMKKKYLTPNR